MVLKIEQSFTHTFVEWPTQGLVYVFKQVFESAHYSFYSDFHNEIPMIITSFLIVGFNCKIWIKEKWVNELEHELLHTFTHVIKHILAHF